MTFLFPRVCVIELKKNFLTARELLKGEVISPCREGSTLAKRGRHLQTKVRSSPLIANITV